jgi:hypothetical protein
LSLLTEEVGHRIEALCPFFDQFVFDPVGLLQIGHALLKLSDETVETLQVGLWKEGGSSHERHNAPELFAFSETHWNSLTVLMFAFSHRALVASALPIMAS